MVTSSRLRLGLAAVVLAAVLARLGLASPWNGRAPDDPDNYLPLARALASGRGLTLPDGRPTAYRPPLYPILLAPATLLPTRLLPWALAVLHAGLGAGTVALTAVTARRWGLGQLRGLAAAAIVAFDPVLVAQSRAVMTETLAAFLLASALAVLGPPRGPSRRELVLGGLILGLAGLCRPSTLAVAAAFGLVLLLWSPGRSGLRALRAALLLGVLTITMTPWAARNARIFGEPVWTTTHGGYTMALANNPVYYDEVLNGPARAVWSGPNQVQWWRAITNETAGMSEPQADRYLASAGWRMLRERPGDFLRAALARLGRFWGITPSSSVYPRWLRAATAVWTVPLWMALLFSLTRADSWRWPRVLVPAMLVALTVVHAVYWTDLRMRAPLVPAIALLAVSARSPRNSHFSAVQIW